MIKLLTIVGARPQFIKAAALSRAIRNNFSNRISEIILHTGQHYDHNMSAVFFEEMEVPKPKYDLGIGSGAHGDQTAKMISGIEEVLQKEKPDAVLVYGDTNSTLAGALAAVKMHIPVIHVEAGLRSFNKYMPEEINRVLTDHSATLLFTPTKHGLSNIRNEGIKESAPPYNLDNPGVFFCGDIMYDNSIYFSNRASESSKILINLNLKDVEFVLATIHRNNNTDNTGRLTEIFNALLKIALDIKVVLPLHPRTNDAMKRLSPDLLKMIREQKNIIFSNPLSYLDMLLLEKMSKMIITDSGGVQKESFFFKSPCLVLRAESEWIELIENGNNLLVDADSSRIIEGYKKLSAKTDFTYPELYGDGHSAEFICETIISTFG